MSIEVATYIADLQPVNPPANDPRSQGDDHLRLIKQVLQNNFPGVAKAIYFDSVVSKTANFTIVAADMNKLHLVSTAAGAVTATLPTLTAGDSGWTCRFMKTSTDANPIFVAPAAGTLTSGAISGLAQARRCVAGLEFRALWTGSAWIITRSITLQIGSMVDYSSATLPAGYEWPNGQTFSSAANYPEYNAVRGGLGTMDLRGRVAVTLDNLGGAAAGLLGNFISGGAVGNVGGTETVTLTPNQIPSITSSGSSSVTVSASQSYPSITTWSGFTPIAANTGSYYVPYGVSSVGISFINSMSGSITINSTSNNTGGAFHSNLQPSIMCTKLLVVE